MAERQAITDRTHEEPAATTNRRPTRARPQRRRSAAAANAGAVLRETPTAQATRAKRRRQSTSLRPYLGHQRRARGPELAAVNADRTGSVAERPVGPRHATPRPDARFGRRAASPSKCWSPHKRPTRSNVWQTLRPIRLLGVCGWLTPAGARRAGVGFVGVPHGVELPIGQMFARTVGVRGGGAPVRVYLPELLDDVLAGRINPGRVPAAGTRASSTASPMPITAQPRSGCCPGHDTSRQHPRPLLRSTRSVFSRATRSRRWS